MKKLKKSERKLSNNLQPNIFIDKLLNIKHTPVFQLILWSSSLSFHRTLYIKCKKPKPYLSRFPRNDQSYLFKTKTAPQNSTNPLPPSSSIHNFKLQLFIFNLIHIHNTYIPNLILKAQI